MTRRSSKASRNRVKVEGLDVYIRDLNLAPAQVKQADTLFRNLAAQIVADSAREKGQAYGGIAKKASEDVRVSGLGRVALSGSPYDMGAEYGAYAYKQFEPWRGKGEDAGYFFWPAVREYRENNMSQDWVNLVWKTVSAFSNKS